MSKGLGKIQREILEAVQKDGVIALRDLPYSQPAISRAAYSLQGRGLVNLWITGINTQCIYPDLWGDREKKLAYRRCLLAVAPGTTREQLFELAKRYRVKSYTGGNLPLA